VIEDDEERSAERDAIGRRRTKEQPRKATTSTTARTQVKKYAGRRVWTDKERAAIKRGLVRFGESKWADIKDKYHSVLADRTSVQIKVSACTTSIVLQHTPPKGSMMYRNEIALTQSMHV
jgi:hypothetical protein